MNREIKFREWLNGKMEYDIYTDYGESISINDYCSRLMQYTGLIDINGKDIYEGDIILNTFSSMYGNEKHIEVVYYNNGYHFKNAGAHTNNQVLEVIGNIYENPELLK